MDNDIILIKIQIHFLHFLVNFANDAIKTEFTDKLKNLNFKNLVYAINRCIKKDHLYLIFYQAYFFFLF